MKTITQIASLKEDKAIHILERVKDWMDAGVPNAVIKDLIAEMELNIITLERKRAESLFERLMETQSVLDALTPLLEKKPDKEQWDKLTAIANVAIQNHQLAVDLITVRE